MVGLRKSDWYDSTALFNLFIVSVSLSEGREMCRSMSELFLIAIPDFVFESKFVGGDEIFLLEVVGIR